MIKTLSKLVKIAKSSILFPEDTLNDMIVGRTVRQSSERFARTQYFETSEFCDPKSQGNPLREYFEAHREGRGIWKWDHYFDMYHRHLSRFVGLETKLVEIGIYSGGSLEMWRQYFGSGCHVYGVDIENACKAYETDNISVFIGDQERPEFWQSFKASVGTVDILIDDGGHTPEQQIVTLNEMLEAIRPGGVYICEDIHGHKNRFINHVVGLVHSLNFAEHAFDEDGISNPANSVQSSIYAITFYPYALVIEKMASPRTGLTAPRHGTQWQPFYPDYA
jgi:SAM-dependent methyltransferase